MQKTSQQTQESGSLDNDPWMKQFVENTRQALLDADRKYPPIDLEHYKATGEFRRMPVSPASETAPSEQS